MIIYFQKALYGTSFNNEYNDRGAHFSVLRKIENKIAKPETFPTSNMHEYGPISKPVRRKHIFGWRKRPMARGKYYRNYPISKQRILRLYFLPRNHKYFL